MVSYVLTNGHQLYLFLTGLFLQPLISFAIKLLLENLCNKESYILQDTEMVGSETAKEWNKKVKHNKLMESDSLRMEVTQR